MTAETKRKNDDASRIVRFVAVKALIFIVLPAVLSALAIYLML